MTTPEGPTLGDYVKLGWHMFPCHSIVDGACSCGDRNCDSPGKHPRTFNGVKAATKDLEQLRAWWQQYPDANWALATGQISGVVVIDIDQRKGGYDSFEEYEHNRRAPGDFGSTLIADTGGGGRHLFIAAPARKVGNRVNWRPGVDIRGDGGYVILPPGTHISGGTYSWKNWGTRLMSAPEDWVDTVTPGASSGSVAGDKSVISDLTADDFVSGIEEGQRDDVLFRMACRLRRQLGDNRAAITLLVLTAANNSTPPFSEKEALKKVDQAFKQDHHDLEAMLMADGGDGEDDEPLAHLTDMGNRDRFVKAFGDDYRFVVGLGWHKWADDGWHKVEELTPHRDAQEVPDMIRFEASKIGDLASKTRWLRWATDSESTGKIASILVLARGHERIKKNIDDFDSNPYLLACANGMVDLRDGTIRQFTRDDLFTRNTRVVYERGFKHPKWDGFMDSITGGDHELADYLQMAAGYTLSGSIDEECFFIVSGLRQTGKSTYMAALESALGTYADVSSAETFMKRYGKEAPREELVKMAGARLITAEEIPEGERFDDALLKRITGGSRISARYLYQEAFSYLPQFKLWLPTNHDPITSDSAMFRRIKRVPFNVQIPDDKKDRSLKGFVRDKQVGARAILAWAVEGAIKYFEQGALETPTSVLISTAAYQAEQDSFSHFMNETFFVRAGEKLPETVAFQLHSNWSKLNHERTMKRAQFAQKLRERGYKFSVDEETQTRFVLDLAIRVSTYAPTL